MSGIETVVRPFQLPQTTNAKRSPLGLSTPAAPLVRLEIGRVGATRVFHASFSASTTVYEKKQPKEITQR